MATISKFYLLDAATPNTGTMPGSSDAFAAVSGTSADATGDATDARTARDATDTTGSSNPDVESTVTANADQNLQRWGHRRFVSRPLAAQTLPTGTWTFSYARSESNLSHNQIIRCCISVWRPGTGFVNSTVVQFGAITGTEPTSAGTEQAEAPTQPANSGVTVNDGDVLVFEVSTTFTQSMSTAYTETFAYDGTTEASTTTCATFVTPPSALTLYTPAIAIPDLAMALTVT